MGTATLVASATSIFMAILELCKDAPPSCQGSHRLAGESMGLVAPSGFWFG